MYNHVITKYTIIHFQIHEVSIENKNIYVLCFVVIEYHHNLAL